jgi:catechol 2,3-dioxygenase-like lactoylglutathione lyase family enzyme
MSITEQSSAAATQVPETRSMDMRLQVAILPASDADRTKQFYASLGWRADADFVFAEDLRVPQFTPPGSHASIIFGTGVTPARAAARVGSLLLAVDDIDAARAESIERGVDVSDDWWDWYAPYLSAREHGNSSAQASAAADLYMKEARGVVVSG